MSGTSLDGLDLVKCHFRETEAGWHFDIDQAVTLPYTSAWKNRLETAHTLSGEALVQLDRDYGAEIGRQILAHIRFGIAPPTLVSSHGHTVFHKPELGYTLQIGSGNAMAAVTGLPVVYDLRSLDVALGGQGAPLVPVGDKVLFSEFDACLNLGGFSNISFDIQGERKAFDICPVNILLNALVRDFGLDCDLDGNIGRQGKVIDELLDQMNALPYYAASPPKSLSREWLEQYIEPLITQSNWDTQDILATVYEHIATQIATIAGTYGLQYILLTGGGALNSFLVEKIKEKVSGTIVVPDREIIEFKEALIFGFLGLLRYLGRVNCLASVTGARSDSSGGVLAGL